MWHVSTHAYVALEIYTFNTKALLILIMSAFLQKMSIFWQK